ncbi:MAG: class I SAM-dependent RNA methyltransferase [Treponema sp.]|nr:class I SAM-dependent RNA methyltransferase [Treponema sp.]
MKHDNSASAVHSAVALCGLGIEKAVSNELKKLGLSVKESAFGKVRFSADIEGLYRALCGLRAADRVLLEAAVFKATDFDALFEGARSVKWEKLVPAHMGVRLVKARSSRSGLDAETSIQSVAHKAIARRLCEARGLSRLPETAEDAEARVHIDRDEVSLLLDLSGEPLFKRGYRKKGGPAPLRETTAAALILLSGWKRKYPFYDPFCGSGTFLAEALMYAWDMAPGLGRDFAISRLLIADEAAEERVRSQLREKINFDRIIRIAGSDEDEESANLARANLRALAELAGAGAQSGALPEIRALSMEEARPDFARGEDSTGFIITNPPYGKRLGNPADAQRLYAQMPKLARNFPEWKLGVICNHPGFESLFQKKADSRREISNGSERAYFYQYECLRK